jgi:hypothetical protein
VYCSAVARVFTSIGKPEDEPTASVFKYFYAEELKKRHGLERTL